MLAFLFPSFLYGYRLPRQAVCARVVAADGFQEERFPFFPDHLTPPPGISKGSLPLAGIDGHRPSGCETRPG